MKSCLPAALIFGGALAGCSAPPAAPSPAVPPRVMNVTPIGAGTTEAPCMAEVGGRRIPVDDFPAFAQRWPGREAHLNADMRTPYRCAGPILYELQRAGFRIGFIAEPPPATESSQ